MASARGFNVVFMLAILLIVSCGAHGAATIVYENKNQTFGEYTPEGFWAFNSFTAIDPEGKIKYVDGTGDHIRLAEGTDRTVVKFDLYLSSTESTTLSSLTLVFYALGDEIAPGLNYPGEVLWTGTKTNVDVFGFAPVSFDGLSVEVPDEFIWAAFADSDLAGPATCGPPTIGQSNVYDFFWYYDDYYDEWNYYYFEGDPLADFGAVVWAVPEPSFTMLFLVGGWLAARWKRRR